jgi:DNA-binding HxlR family transcriptional regulator
MGKDLGGVLEQLNKWGEKWLEKPQPAKKSKPRSAQISGRP